VQFPYPFEDQDAEAHRRWQEPAASSGAIGRRSVISCSGIFDSLYFLIHGIVDALFFGCIFGNKVAGEIPTRRWFGQKLGRKRVVVTWPDQIEPESLNQFCTYRDAL
jgi:hypothetical protein